MDEPRKPPLFQTDGQDDPCVVQRGQQHVILDRRLLPEGSRLLRELPKRKIWIVYTFSGQDMGSYLAFPYRRTALASFNRLEAAYAEQENS